MDLGMELAMRRYAVVAQFWATLASGNPPIPSAFLAGWYCCVIGMPMPHVRDEFRDSFRAGYREAEDTIAIAERQRASEAAQCDI